MSSCAGRRKSAGYEAKPSGDVSRKDGLAILLFRRADGEAERPEAGAAVRGESIEAAIAAMRKATALYLEEFIAPWRDA